MYNPCIPYHISSKRSCHRSKRLRCEVVVSSVFRGFCQTYSLRIRRLQHAHASITRTSGRRAFGSMGRLGRYTVHLDLDCLSKSMFLVLHKALRMHQSTNLQPPNTPTAWFPVAKYVTSLDVTSGLSANLADGDSHLRWQKSQFTKQEGQKGAIKDYRIAQEQLWNYYLKSKIQDASSR